MRALVAGHRCVDEAEADSQRRILALIEEAPDPRSRHHFEPGHLTASAVVVDHELERALLIFHAKLGLWLQPGGHFEPAELDPLSAALREVREETGIAALPYEGDALRPGSPPDDLPTRSLLDLDVHAIPARKSEPLHHHFDLRFLVVAPPGAQPYAGDGAEAIRWIEAPVSGSVSGSVSGTVSGGPELLAELDPGLRRALGKVPWRR